MYRYIPHLYFAPRIDAIPFFLHNTSAKCNDFNQKLYSIPGTTLWLAFLCPAFSSIRNETNFLHDGKSTRVSSFRDLNVAMEKLASA